MLQSTPYKLSDNSTDQDRLVCTDPKAFADAVCLIHVDDPRKVFKIEAER